jgi:hypothetical protein
MRENKCKLGTLEAERKKFLKSWEEYNEQAANKESSYPRRDQARANGAAGSSLFSGEVPAAARKVPCPPGQPPPVVLPFLLLLGVPQPCPPPKRRRPSLRAFGRCGREDDR